MNIDHIVQLYNWWPSSEYNGHSVILWGSSQLSGCDSGIAVPWIRSLLRIRPIWGDNKMGWLSGPIQNRQCYSSPSNTMHSYLMLFKRSIHTTSFEHVLSTFPNTFCHTLIFVTPFCNNAFAIQLDLYCNTFATRFCNTM